MYTINFGGHLLPLHTPKIMGILNITTDSFYDGGKYNQVDKALTQFEKMLSEGADIIDIGSFSSRPKAPLVPAGEQIEKMDIILSEIFKSYPEIPLSIDTYSSGVVKHFAEKGPFMVNDISGFAFDDNLVSTVAELKLPYVLMHMRGKPETMLDLAKYDDISFEILKYLANKIQLLRQQGVEDIVIDPGFGFAKSIDQNFELLRKLEVFGVLDYPVMVGLSRKSMIYKTLGMKPENALNGTTALHMLALERGAKILRVHDVQEASECRNLWLKFNQGVNE